MAGVCYKPQYLPASFKGVVFEAEEVTSEHGRRGAEGEFPFSENTAYADLGRKIRRYTLKGRYQTNSHIASAALLIAACESPGPGLLIHPTRGAITAACVKLSVTDDPLLDQGITHLDMEFVEANLVATGAALGFALFGLSTVALFAAMAEEFDDDYDLDEVRYYRKNEVLATSSDAMDSIKAEFSKAIAGTTDNKDWAALSTMQTFVNDTARLQESEDAFKAFRQSIQTLANKIQGRKKYDAFRNISNAMAQTSKLPEEAGVAEDAVFATVRIMAVTQMVNGALADDTVTIAEALAQYDAITTIIDEELSAARLSCNDDLYIELRRYETEAKTALLKRAYGLPALVSYHFSGGVHSLVAAYEIFGDAKRFGEIEARNPGSFPWAVGPDVIAVRQ